LTKSVGELEAAGVLLVQDGNHGEYRPRREELVPDGTPHIRAADISDAGVIDFAGAQRINDVALARIRKGVGAPGDVLLTHKGTVGRVARAPAEAPHFVCSPQTTFWRSLDSNQLDQTFVFAYLRSPSFAAQLRTRMHESDMAPYVSLTAQRSFVLPLPPISEQRRIAAVLGVLDDKIESNRRLAGLLEETVATLFRARFVDFVGVDEFEDSKIGRIPRGWRVGSLYDIARVTYGRPFKSSLFNDSEGTPLIRIRDLPGNEPSVLTPESRTDARLIRRRDIVVGMDGEFRAYVWAGPDSWLNQRVCVVDPQDTISRAFVLEAIKRPLAFFEATKGGTTVIHLGKRDIDTFAMVVPPPMVMREFGVAADSMLALAVELRWESRTLASCRDALLPKLVSGQVRVPNTCDPAEVIEPAAEALAASS
jgi:type I restriction enzyme S subunit